MLLHATQRSATHPSYVRSLWCNCLAAEPPPGQAPLRCSSGPRTSAALHQPHRLQHGPEVLPPVGHAVDSACGAAERGATAVDNARHPVDERGVRHAHAAVHKCLELCLVLEAAVVPRLHLDGLRVAAEVNVGEERGTALSRCARAQKVVELAKVADACGLDDATAPEAAALHISARVATKRGRRIVWAAARARLPHAVLLALVVCARAACLHVAQVLVKRHVHIALLVWVAPAAAVVPPRRLGHLGARRAEECGRGAVPLCVRRGTHLKVGVHLALLPARIGRGVARRLVPVVLVTRVVLDRLLHALRQERRHADEAIPPPGRPRALTQPKRAASDAVGVHCRERRHGVGPAVDGAGRPRQEGRQRWEVWATAEGRATAQATAEAQVQAGAMARATAEVPAQA
eukprot:364233-Chlamydomonas_euryale.AAC.10